MPNDAELDEQRLVMLETKLAYQEKTIADLNDVIIAQGRELADFRRRIDVLERFVREHMEAPSAPNEKPPHY